VIQYLGELRGLTVIVITVLEADLKVVRVRNGGVRNVSQLRFHLLHMRGPKNLPRIIDGNPADIWMINIKINGGADVFEFVFSRK